MANTTVNIDQLADYLDFLDPMIYKGNYKKGTAWIASTTKYIYVDISGMSIACQNS